MTRKKLGFMNVHSQEVLSRDEMRSIMAGSGDPNTCTCSHNGCFATLSQYSHGWTLALTCDGNSTTDDGYGEYGGTICGGSCP